jgi:hypothetical protein
MVATVLGLAVAAFCGCSDNGSGKAANEQVTASPGQKAASAGTYQLELVFTGPWSFIKDSIGKRIVAVAPLIQGHSGLYVRSTSGLPVPTGNYDLGLSNPQSLQSGNPAPRFVPETPVSIGGGLLNGFEGTPTGNRYVLNLPDTQFVQAVYTDPLAYSNAYAVPAPVVSKTYTTKVVFRYAVDSLDVVVKGTAVDPNTSVMSAFNNSITTEGTMDIFIDDAPDASNCDDGAKGTFKAMNSLMKTGLYVDYPPYSVGCEKEDPQNPHAAGESMPMNKKTFAAMKADVLRGLGKIEAYAKDLSKDPDLKGVSEQIRERVRAIQKQVEMWPETGPSDKQLGAFVTGVSQLRDFVVHKEDIKKTYRDNFTNITDQVIPFNISGKNCKAPLMLLVSP